HWAFEEVSAALPGGYGHVHSQGKSETTIPLMVSHSLVIGHHGCDFPMAEKVIAQGGDLKPSQNAWDWLGHGIYFWEDSYARAMRWAESKRERQGRKIKKPAVVGAVIDLGHCLNLTDAESLQLVRAAHSEYARLCSAAGV